MSGIDIVIAIRNLLNVPAITAVARVWQHNRPQNSDKTDIVISIPNYAYGVFNTGYVDIDIHTPNIVTHIDSKDDRTFPDMGKLKQVTDIVVPLIASTPEYRLSPTIVGVPTRDKDGNWYVNIRVNFEGINSLLAHTVSLVELKSESDGYGGSIVNSSVQWTGKAVQENIGNGTQLNINAGRYSFNLRSDWVVPWGIGVEKNWELHHEGDVYVINGIIPDNGFTRLSTVRED